MPDRIFADPRLAAIYDEIDGERSDLEHYEAILDEIGARTVLDIGCGTGELACRLALRGITTIGMDPAEASLEVARRKPGGDLVAWLSGDVDALPPLAADAVVMTGNVAQVFVSDAQWSTVLSASRVALRRGGHLVFESRDPSFRAWEEWTRERTFAVTNTVAGLVEHWVELTDVAVPLVSFRHSFRFIDGGELLTSESTLRFRERDELIAALREHGFEIDDVRDAPDRPSREFVFICRSRQT